jgi:hypothetical protein
MTELGFKVAHEELLSLVHSGAEEIEKGEVNAGISLLIEAQFLLGELIQQQLNAHDAPPLSPFVGECADEERQAATATMA